MNGSAILALATAAAALVALALVAFMFWRGKWLFLVAGGAAAAEAAGNPSDGDCARGEAGSGAEGGARGIRKMARRMAVVLLIGCVLVATLLLYEAAKLSGNTPLAWALSMANNAAFVALLVGMVWFFVVQRPDRSKEDAEPQESPVAARARSARLDHLPLAVIVFTIVFIAVIALVGILFAGV